nr:cell division protein FtsZ [Solirubrobacterales bacterium]
MARPKRASMREGPLADLFRSTEQPDDPPEPPPRPEPRRRQAESEPAPEPAAPEPPYEEPPAPAPAPRPAKDRLRDVFSSDTEEREPAYGRGEPSRTSATAPPQVNDPVIKVVGVGGGGVNAVNRMVEAGIGGVEFMAVNTDLQSLQTSAADLTIHIGGGVTRGLGSGSDPELGYRAAFEEQDRIKRMLKGSDMVFVAAGAGGGTGTGAAPVIARLARDVGALTVGIVT